MPKPPPLTDEMPLRFQQRAPGYDQQNRFFEEDFEELRASGDLQMAIPKELGGLGMRPPRSPASSGGWDTTRPPTRWR